MLTSLCLDIYSCTFFSSYQIWKLIPKEQLGIQRFPKENIPLVALLHKLQNITWIHHISLNLFWNNTKKDMGIKSRIRWVTKISKSFIRHNVQSVFLALGKPVGSGFEKKIRFRVWVWIKGKYPLWLGFWVLTETSLIIRMMEWKAGYRYL